MQSAKYHGVAYKLHIFASSDTLWNHDNYDETKYWETNITTQCIIDMFSIIRPLTYCKTYRIEWFTSRAPKLYMQIIARKNSFVKLCFCLKYYKYIRPLNFQTIHIVTSPSQSCTMKNDYHKQKTHVLIRKHCIAQKYSPFLQVCWFEDNA